MLLTRCWCSAAGLKRVSASSSLTLSSLCRFAKLPAWVKLMVTSRPQVEAAFKAWGPKWIEPESAQNRRDMLQLLLDRLKHQSVLANGAQDQQEAAAQLMLEKSQGQFIYTKFAFEELGGDKKWTVAELERALPTGLAGMYAHAMRVLCGALDKERPDLLALLQGRLLPALVACREPLTVEQLAWACGATVQDVSASPAVCGVCVWVEQAARLAALACTHRWTCWCGCWPTSSLCGAWRRRPLGQG